MNVNEMRDWQPRLRANFASITLGKALYEAAVATYTPALSPRAFETLPFTKRREYIEAASRLLEQLKPAVLHGR